MVAWPPSEGEAIHTSTFLGHPVGCAMGLAQIEELRRRKLVERSAEMGKELLGMLEALDPNRSKLSLAARGVGLMAGLEFKVKGGTAGPIVMQVIQRMLGAGYILLPEGDEGQVLGFTPPLTVTARQLQSTVNRLAEVLSR